MFGLVTSQIGCAGKVTKISTQLDQVKFDKDYKYIVKLKSGDQTKEYVGTQVQAKVDQLLLNTPTEFKSLMIQDIQHVDGKSAVRNGSYALQGLGYGFLIGFGGGGALGVAALNDCFGWDTCDKNVGNYFVASLVFGVIFGVPASLVGLGIGALIPKHDKIQITPIMSPTAQGGVDAGLNVGVKF